eukprot:7128055-Pyramimonas_sp.AAC.1
MDAVKTQEAKMLNRNAFPREWNGFLGSFWGVLGRLGAVAVPSGAVLEHSWGALGGLEGQSQPIWLSGTSGGRLESAPGRGGTV